MRLEQQELRQTEAGVERAVQQLIEEAIAAGECERRQDVRFPFFCPVTFTPQSEPHRNYSAFARDISSSGIGLLHNMPLDAEQATLTLIRPGKPNIALRAQIAWCRPCGEGWYLSGGQFLDRTSGMNS